MPLIKKSAEADVAQSIEGRGAKARAVLRAQLGDDPAGGGSVFGLCKMNGKSMFEKFCV